LVEGKGIMWHIQYDHLINTIDLYLFSYQWSDEIRSFIKELVHSCDLDNLKLALAILEGTENKPIKIKK